MKKILIADDNLKIIEVLKRYVEKEGYEVHTALNGRTALEMFSKDIYEMVLLDVMMPEMDGLEVCREIRRVSMTPIIMITAKADDYDKIMGLDTGADDYIVKPFSPSEVTARIRAILRRMNSAEMKRQEVLASGSLTICLDRFQVFVSEQEVYLTKKEVEILWSRCRTRAEHLPEIRFWIRCGDMIIMEMQER